MTPEDNLERFFKNRLEADSKLPEEEWSIPSDDLWEAAKVHFPKKKKKDRAIFFWLGLGLCGLIMGVGFFSFLTQKVPSKIVQLPTNNRAIPKQIQEEKNTNQSVVVTNLEKDKSAIKKEMLATPTNTLPVNKRSVKQNKSVLKTNRNSNEKEWRVPTFKPVKEIVSKVNTPIPINKTQVRESVVKPILATKNAVLAKLKSPIALLEIGKRPLKLEVALPAIIEPVKLPLKKWEVGLSYAPFIIIQESIINGGIESPFEKVTIGITHQNVNFSIRRYIHPRFSVSSGLYLSKGKFDIAVCDTRIYEDNSPARLGYFLRQSNPTNQIQLEEIGLDIDASVEYVADANLNSGDVLTIEGGVPFNIKFVQMPLLLNVHFGKRKIKGLVHTGISVDYQQVKANDLRLDIFKGADLISKPIVVEPLNEQTLKVRWQAGLGLRYAIKDFLQVGSGLNINITDPILSRYDFGVYYGF